MHAHDTAQGFGRFWCDGAAGMMCAESFLTEKKIGAVVRGAGFL